MPRADPVFSAAKRDIRSSQAEVRGRGLFTVTNPHSGECTLKSVGASNVQSHVPVTPVVSSDPVVFRQHPALLARRAAVFRRGVDPLRMVQPPEFFGVDSHQSGVVSICQSTDLPLRRIE